MFFVEFSVFFVKLLFLYITFLLMPELGILVVWIMEPYSTSSSILHSSFSFKFVGCGAKVIESMSTLVSSFILGSS